MLMATTTYMSHSLLAVELHDPQISRCDEQDHYSALNESCARP